MYIHLMNKISFRCFFVASLLLLTACAGKPVTPIFYPGEPDPPRYQYLKTINSEADLKKSSLAKALAEGAFGFQKAYGVAAYKSTLIVTDSQIHGYVVIDLETNKFKFVTRDPSNRHSNIDAPFGLAVDENGTRYIADRGASRVLIFDKNDKYLRSIDFDSANSSPLDVAVDQKNVYIAHIKHNRIDVFNLETNTLSKLDTGNKSLEWPVAIDFKNDHLYVAEMLQYSVAKLARSGELIETYGGLGSELGNLARPKGVAVDNNNNLLVVDASFANFQIFREDGRLLGFVAEGGQKPENLSLPAGICVSYDLAPYFQEYAAPGFKLEYIVAIATQTGPSKVNIYGFGKMEGQEYKD